MPELTACAWGLTMIEKHPPYRNKRLRDTRGEACQICGVRDDTVVGAHYQGLYSQRLGKGMGQKPTDLAIFAACRDCHAKVDNYEHGNIDQQAAFLLSLALERLNRILPEMIP